MKLVWIVVLLIILFGTGLVAGYWWLTPRLLEVAPADGALDVQSAAGLRLRFSRPLRPETLAGRLEFEPAQSGSFTWQDQALLFTPDRPWPNSQIIQARLLPGARAAGWPGLPLRQGASWSFTTARPRLAYLYPTDGPSNIYVLDPDTGESQQLTQSQGGVLDYDVDANGAAIYYSLHSGRGGSNIYRLDLISAGQETEASLVVECPQASCRSPRLSPQGDFLAYEQTAYLGSGLPTYPQVWLLPLGAETPASPGQPASPGEPFTAGDPLHQTLQPEWSQDGRLAFYDTSQSAYVLLEPHSGQATLFQNQTGQQGSWSPDGSAFVAPEILFVDLGGLVDQPELSQISSSHLMRFDIGDESTSDLTVGENLEDTSPAFSPDGKQLAFARKYLDVTRWTPGRQAWLMGAQGESARELTEDPFYNHYTFAWSPAGDQLAYVRFNQVLPTEPPEVWLLDLDTGQKNQLVVGGYNPQWMP